MGTPRTFAIDRPPIMTAIARARWSLSTMAMATAAPTAQKAGAGECGDHAGGEEELVGGGQRARDLPEAEEADEGDEGGAAGEAQGGYGQQRGSDDHADREGGYEQARLRNGDAHVLGDGWQQPGEHEFAGAEREHGQSEDVDGDGHAGACCDCGHDCHQPARTRSNSPGCVIRVA